MNFNLFKIKVSFLKSYSNKTDDFIYIVNENYGNVPDQDYSVKCPTHLIAKCAEGEYYDDVKTQFGQRIFPPRTIDDVQHAIEAINTLGAQGALSPQGPTGAQGPIGPQGAQGLLAGALGASGENPEIDFSSATFTNIPGYPTVTIPTGASGASFYVEAGFSPLIQYYGATGGSAFIQGIINHSVVGNITNTQKSVALNTDVGPMTAQFDLNMSTVVQLPAGTLTVAGNTGGDTWRITLGNIHFFQLTS